MTTLADLGGVKRWVSWQTQKRRGAKPDEKPTKVPFDPETGKEAKANDPRTWATREQARRHAATLPRPFGHGGVGIELGDLGNGMWAAGVDLDTCRDAATGRVALWAFEVIQRCASYTEESPSGSGYKIFCQVLAADVTRITPLLTGEMKSGRKFSRDGGDKEHPEAIEFYVEKRYFAVTGKALPGWENVPLNLISADTIEWLLKVAGPAFAAGADTLASAAPPEIPENAGARLGRGDQSRSAVAFNMARTMRRNGATKADFFEACRAHPETTTWCIEKGNAHGGRELNRAWEKAALNDDWQLKCSISKAGGLFSNSHNCRIALEHAPDLAGLYAYDEMLRQVVVLRDLGDTKPLPRPRAVKDSDTVALQQWLQRYGLTSVSRNTVADAIDLHARRNAWHPLRYWLCMLHWDGVPRLNTWLSDHLGVIQTEYAQEVGRMFLIGMVARILHPPPVQLDHMIILEGEQGAQKSKACRTLASDEYFSDAMPDLRSAGKDAAAHLNGKWLIELAELSAMSKIDAAALKAFLSRSVEKYRPSYGRFEVVEPRQACFIGTTNETAYLRDPTGARRFWPVKVGRIDIPALQAARDQLFAEAVAYYRQGWPWWPSREMEQRLFVVEQDLRYERDPWSDKVEGYLADKLTKPTEQQRTTVGDVALNALGMHVKEVRVAEQRRIAATMERFGWERAQRWGAGRWWIPKGVTQ